MLQKHHGILPTQKISVDANNPITVSDAIRNTIDLCSPMKKKRLYLLAQYATDPVERRALHLLCSNASGGDDDRNGSGGKELSNLYQSYVEDQRRTVVDILKEFPSCQSITLEGLLGCLPAIPPRYYSVCSSPLKDRNDELHGHHFHLKVAFSVVDYLSPSALHDPKSNRRIGGLATRYLECLCSPFLCSSVNNVIDFPKPTISIFPKPTHEFRLPPNLSTPLILIGPGTGIAPFLGFLSHRQAQIASLESTEAAEMASEGTWRGGYELDTEELHISKHDARGLNLAVDFMRKQKAGDVDVFFGCRYSDHDWLYQKEIEEFKSLGIVSNLYLAFSREKGQKEKTYVQTIMTKDEKCGRRLVEMITEKNASVYVCGDGNAMGRDVQDAIVKLLAEKKYGDDVDEKSSMDKAVAYMEQMKTFGRFVLDIWS
jgi:sulfite reductase alpha subunit-like flavoprotein